MTTIQGGQPMSVYNEAGGSAYYGGNNAGTGEGGNSTGQLASGITYGQIRDSGGIEANPVVTGGSFQGLQYFNPNAFTTPPAISPTGQITTLANCAGCATLFGNSGQGIFLGPGQVNFDASIIKTTLFKEEAERPIPGGIFQSGQPSAVCQPRKPAVDHCHLWVDQRHHRRSPRIIQLALKYLF